MYKIMSLILLTILCLSIKRVDNNVVEWVEMPSKMILIDTRKWRVGEGWCMVGLEK